MPNVSPTVPNSVTQKKRHFVKSAWLALMLATCRASAFMVTQDPATIATLCWLPTVYVT